MDKSTGSKEADFKKEIKTMILEKYEEAESNTAAADKAAAGKGLNSVTVSKVL